MTDGYTDNGRVVGAGLAATRPILHVTQDAR